MTDTIGEICMRHEQLENRVTTLSERMEKLEGKIQQLPDLLATRVEQQILKIFRENSSAATSRETYDQVTSQGDTDDVRESTSSSVRRRSTATSQSSSSENDVVPGT